MYATFRRDEVSRSWSWRKRYSLRKIKVREIKKRLVIKRKV